jgi:hypothetical protein
MKERTKNGAPEWVRLTEYTRRFCECGGVLEALAFADHHALIQQLEGGKVLTALSGESPWPWSLDSRDIRCGRHNVYI